MLEKIAGKMEEEVLNKYKVEDSERGAYRGRGTPLEWRRAGRSKKYRTHGVKTVGEGSSLGSESTICSAYKVLLRA